MIKSSYAILLTPVLGKFDSLTFLSKGFREESGGNALSKEGTESENFPVVFLRSLRIANTEWHLFRREANRAIFSCPNVKYYHSETSHIFPFLSWPLPLSQQNPRYSLFPLSTRVSFVELSFFSFSRSSFFWNSSPPLLTHFPLSFPEIMEAEKGSIRSNLECFLHCTTPLVPSRFLPMSEVRNLNRIWHPWERENVEHFTMNDLWNCYDEWSAYGAGVPIFHSKEETLVQYYVPYLSAIQIFTSNPPAPIFREDADLVDGDTRDSCSESCSDESESDKLSFRWDGCSSEDGGFEQESLPQLNDRLGYLYCQYIERSTPYGRVPLKDKISTLAQRYPALMSLKSVDLSPASWMSVAWYPIYHIPMGRTIKDLSTCFLTYHTLSSSFQDMDREDEIEGVGWKRKEGEGIPLPPFGLVTHKMQGSVWLSGRDGRDPERLGLLLSVANSWLKQLRVQHHDFNFFTGIHHG